MMMVYLNKPTHLKHNKQRLTTDLQNPKSCSFPLSHTHTHRLTQASQSAVCPADADWWWAVLTRHMRGSSIKDGLGRAETGSYLPGNNTQTTEFRLSIINQAHIETFYPCPALQVTQIIRHRDTYWHHVKLSSYMKCCCLHPLSFHKLSIHPTVTSPFQPQQVYLIQH